MRPRGAIPRAGGGCLFLIFRFRVTKKKPHDLGPLTEPAPTSTLPQTQARAIFLPVSWPGGAPPGGMPGAPWRTLRHEQDQGDAEDPSIKEMAKQISEDPSFKAMAENMQQAMAAGGAIGAGPGSRRHDHARHAPACPHRPQGRHGGCRAS